MYLYRVTVADMVCQFDGECLYKKNYFKNCVKKSGLLNYLLKPGITNTLIVWVPTKDRKKLNQFFI